MKYFSIAILMAVLFVFSSCNGGTSVTEEASSATEEEAERVSPHATVNAQVGEAMIEITYGRPYKKEREIYGGLVPLDAVWRTGADEATTLMTDRDLMLGELHVPAGKYSLFTIPGESSWTLILNNVADQWGAFDYDESMDLGRTEMSVAMTEEMAEQLTISVEPGEESNGMLNIVWDMTVASLPIIAH